MIRFQDEWDDDDEAEPDHEDGDDLDECPRCGRSIDDDSVRCPRCGAYPSREEPGGTTGRPLWVRLGVLTCLAMVGYWIWHFF